MALIFIVIGWKIIIIREMENSQISDEKNNEITARVIDVIFNALNLKHIDRSTVTLATPLTAGGLNLDSVDILELIVNFESTFGIKVDESESYAQHFKNIGSIVEFIHTRMK
jgi:acyl carrier protein